MRRLAAQKFLQFAGEHWRIFQRRHMACIGNHLQRCAWDRVRAAAPPAGEDVIVLTSQYQRRHPQRLEHRRHPEYEISRLARTSDDMFPRSGCRGGAVSAAMSLRSRTLRAANRLKNSLRSMSRQARQVSAAIDKVGPSAATAPADFHISSSTSAHIRPGRAATPAGGQPPRAPRPATAKRKAHDGHALDLERVEEAERGRGARCVGE